MATTLSSMFTQVFVNDAGGTAREISAYLIAAEPHLSHNATDVSTFNAGGNPTTKGIIRGAANSEFTLKGLFDPVFCKIMRQIIAARAGFFLDMRFGTNALPTFGDERFQMTATILSYVITYNTNAVATVDFDIKPADGGAVMPQWSTI